MGRELIFMDHETKECEVANFHGQVAWSMKISYLPIKISYLAFLRFMVHEN
jgi:hypothetical protein